MPFGGSEPPPSPPADPGFTPSPTRPRFRWKRDGTAFDHVAVGVHFDSLTRFYPGRDDELNWTTAGGPLEAWPDWFSGHMITLEMDRGENPTVWITLFHGRCVGVGYKFTPLGWACSYRALGPSYLANRVPVTNPVDGTDTIAFNLDPDDPRYRIAWAGRTIGYVLMYTLSSPENARALATYGIGSYKSAGGWGAAASAAIAGGGGLNITVTDGGSGYSAANPPRAVLVGGDGTYDSVTVTVNALGEVTTVAAVNPAGWTIAPTVWISPLPVATLDELKALTLIPPFPVYLQGERIWDAVEAVLRQTTRNVNPYIDPDGVMRFRDVRDYDGPTTLRVESPTDLVDVTSIQLSRSVEEAYPRVRIRGGPNVMSVLVGLVGDNAYTADGGLEECFSHDGLTNAQAKTEWSLEDFLQPGEVKGRATFTASRSGTAVSTIAVVNQGYGYAPSTTFPLVISGGGGSGATATCSSNASGRITSATVTAGGTGYTTNPAVAGPYPPHQNRDSGTCEVISATEVSVTSIDPLMGWPVNYWDWSTTGRQGTVFLTDSLSALVEVKFSSRIISCEAMEEGKAALLTLETPLPATGYDTYELIGNAGGAAEVWRKYCVTFTEYASRLVDHFPRPVAYRWSDGQAVSLTSVPTATVFYSSTGAKPWFESPIGIDVDPDAGVIRTHVPVVTKFGTYSNLVTGGAKTDGIPADVQAMLAVANGVHEALCPANAYGYEYGYDEDGYGYTDPEYAGTSYTVEGLEETLTLTIPSWIDAVNQENMNDYACEILDSVKDALIEGSFRLLRFHADLIADFGQKVRLDVHNDVYTLPWEATDLPVQGVTLRMGTASTWTTEITVSTRRNALAASYFDRPMFRGMTLGWDGGYGVTGGVFLGAGVLGHDFLGAAAAQQAGQLAGATGGPYSGAVWQATNAQVGGIGAATNAHVGRIANATKAHTGRVWGGVNKTIDYARQLFRKWLR